MEVPEDAEIGGTGGSNASQKPEDQIASNQVNPAIPEDIPSPQGDDIVAQQLREAAISESDPDLKEKLWDEYRRYKSGL